MTTEFWYGSKPKNSGEQNVLIELYDFLKSKQEKYVLMCNFNAGPGHETDLVILKKNGIFLVEVKKYWEKIVGGKNEKEWKCILSDGKELKFTNPYKQAIGCSHDWSRWCKHKQKELERISGNKRDWEQYRPFLYAVFYPTLHPDSEINIGKHPVHVTDLEKFRTALLIRSMNNLGLTHKEMWAIPKLLRLTRWHIDPPKPSSQTVRIEGDVHPPLVQMLVPRNKGTANKAFYIESGLVVVGRSSSCDLAIIDDSISRKHAKISRVDNYWVVEDLDSLNGTFVSFNGDPETERKVERSNALKNGSIIRFGEISYTVILDK